MSDFKHPWWTMSGESFMEALRRAHAGAASREGKQ